MVIAVVFCITVLYVELFPSVECVRDTFFNRLHLIFADSDELGIDVEFVFGVCDKYTDYIIECGYWKVGIIK